MATDEPGAYVAPSIAPTAPTSPATSAIGSAVASAVDPPEIALADLGLMDYRKTWELQKALAGKLAEELKGTEPVNALLMVEHPHVFTLGRRGKEGANVLSPGKVPVIEVERGGDVTYHGPGQLVVYPVLKLTPAWQDVWRYVNALQQATIDAVAAFGLPAGLRYGEPGVWVVQDDDGNLMDVPALNDQTPPVKQEKPGRPAGPGKHERLAKPAQSPLPTQDPPPAPCGKGRWRKLASVGVAISRWVTYHGVALNVATDLSYFGRINPCGFEGDTMTSMAQLLCREVTLAEVKPVLAAALGRNFGAKFEKIEADELIGMKD